MAAVDVVTRYFAALSARDVEAMAGLWAPDGEEHIASQVDAVGPSGVREYFTELFTAFPDFSLTVQTTVAQDDKVASRYTVRGTHRGPFAGAAPTGNQVTMRGMMIFRLVNGQIAEAWGCADLMGFMRQLNPPSTAK